MPKLLSAAELDVGVEHHLVQLHDEEAEEEALPTPRQVGHPWISAGTSTVLLYSAEDIWNARFFFELWDERPPPLDDVEWPMQEEIGLFLPTGALGLDEFSDVFDLGNPGNYRVRLGWRPLDWQPGGDDSEAQALAMCRFWRDDLP